MLSYYFNIKVNSDEFKNNLNEIINSLNDKKVLIYGAGEDFRELNKIYDFQSKLNIVAIADKKFETCNKIKQCVYKRQFTGLNIIKPNEIPNIDYDYILVINENYKPIIKFLSGKLSIDTDKIKTIFEETVKDERVNLNFLNEHKFEKSLPQLIEKCKNQKVVIYGAGAFFELIKKYYDISSLDIIAISDRKFSIDESETEFLGYKTCKPDDIASLKPDIVLVATKFYIGIIEDLLYCTLENEDIKVKPLVKKPIMTLLKEIWG